MFLLNGEFYREHNPSNGSWMNHRKIAKILSDNGKLYAQEIEWPDDVFSRDNISSVYLNMVNPLRNTVVFTITRNNYGGVSYEFNGEDFVKMENTFDSEYDIDYRIKDIPKEGYFYDDNSFLSFADYSIIHKDIDDIQITSPKLDCVNTIKYFEGYLNMGGDKIIGFIDKELNVTILDQIKNIDNITTLYPVN